MEKVGEELIDVPMRILHLMPASALDADALFRRVMDCREQRPVRYSGVCNG